MIIGDIIEIYHLAIFRSLEFIGGIIIVATQNIIQLDVLKQKLQLLVIILKNLIL